MIILRKPIFLLLACLLVPAVQAATIDTASDGYANNNGVRIHYKSMGSGPLVLFIHGFPDFWYSWRHQMEALSEDYHTVAMDLRGYNLSDAPEGVENYYYDSLVGDVMTVIRGLGETRATIVAHDWGAAIAWRMTTLHPEMVERLVILNVPHPQGLARAASQHEGGLSYANRFMEAGAEENFPPEWLSGWVKDPEAREVYLEAFRRSSISAMLNYYRANFSSGPEVSDEARTRNAIDWKPVQVPVLIIYGEGDPYLPIAGLNDNWEYTDNDLRIEVIQNAGHFVQHDAPGKVTRAIRTWLAARNPDPASLLGAWQVDEITLNSPEQSGTNPDPQPGLFIFTPDHYSIAWIPRPAARAAFATPWKPTDDEIKAAYSTVLFNSGTWELDGARLTTRPLISKVPGLSGGYAVYEYRIEHDTLWLTMLDEYSASGIQAPWVGHVSFPLKLKRIE